MLSWRTLVRSGSHRCGAVSGYRRLNRCVHLSVVVVLADCPCKWQDDNHALPAIRRKCWQKMGADIWVVATWKHAFPRSRASGDLADSWTSCSHCTKLSVIALRGKVVTCSRQSSRWYICPHKLSNNCCILFLGAFLPTM